MILIKENDDGSIIINSSNSDSSGFQLKWLVVAIAMNEKWIKHSTQKLSSNTHTKEDKLYCSLPWKCSVCRGFIDKYRDCWNFSPACIDGLVKHLHFQVGKTSPSQTMSVIENIMTNNAQVSNITKKNIHLLTIKIETFN